MCVGFLNNLRTPAGQIIATKTAAYGFIGLAAFGVYEHMTHGARARLYLPEKGITIPEGKMIERVGYIEYDDAQLVGAAAGFLLARRKSALGSVKGWHRHVGGMAVGLFVGCAVYSAYDLVTMLVSKKRWEDHKGDQLRRVESWTWMKDVKQTLSELEKRKR